MNGNHAKRKTRKNEQNKGRNEKKAKAKNEAYAAGAQCPMAPRNSPL